jgi:UDP-N-acetylmuramoyl-tripeptide--D-alanyl-D-alanine ligase
MDLESELQPLAEAASGYTSDSRHLRPDQVFVALKGDARDGHDFVEEIVRVGKARSVVIDRAYETAHLNLLQQHEVDWLAVDDTHLAHRALAKIFRRRFKGVVLAVGGSSGKTSTKEFLYQLLSKRFSCVKTQKSQNGEQGIPKTLEQLRDGIELAIIEVGIDGPGDMIRHMDLVRPDLGVLTSIGEEHLNLLKDVDGVFREERLLFDAVWNGGGRCFGPASDPYLARFIGRADFQATPARPEDVDAAFRCSLTHPYGLQNAALACVLGRHLKLADELIAQAVANFSLPEGRGQVFEPRPGLVVLADHYNSNPASLKAGLEFARLEGERRKLPVSLVLGDMLDLGPEAPALHERMLSEIRACGPARVLTVGPMMGALAPRLGAPTESFADAAAAASVFDASSWKGVVLVKGSRGMALEKILAKLLPA